MITKKISILIVSLCITNNAFAITDKERIEELEIKVEALATLMEELETNSGQKAGVSKVQIGGYGEIHYANLKNNTTQTAELDMHRFVIFYGYDFNDKMRLISELEVEHVLVNASSRGAVELEQAYLEFDLENERVFRTGLMLMPIGIINETHEPPTFYGVERPVIESSIIPTTWWSIGASLTGNSNSGLSYDLMISEGLKTPDPNATTQTVDPFDLKAGKQKGSFASAFDLALTGRVKYTGIAGLQLSGFVHYQPDLDQSAKVSYADSATLLGGYAMYQLGKIKTTFFYARWDLAGSKAQAAKKDVQQGYYLEASYKLSSTLGFFGRYNEWSQITTESKQQIDAGLNYYPAEDIVFKLDIQNQNSDAGNSNGFHLGVGYQF